MALSTDDLQAFVAAYPGMRVLPSRGGESVLEGLFDFRATPPNGPSVADMYELRIEVPIYPTALPRVFEIGGRIARHIDEHVFPSSGQLCLGSPLRLRQTIGRNLDILQFADRCIVPFLYNSNRRQHDGKFILGELAHGRPGLMDDYKDIFGLSEDHAVVASLRILATKPTSADRHPCPCGCGRRLAQCTFKLLISDLRNLAPRKSFESLHTSLFKSE